MNAIGKLMDEAKEKAGIISDNALAIEMGITRSAINNYRKGKNGPNIYALRRLADLTERSLDEVAALIEIEAENDEKKKAYWKLFYKRLGGVAASLIVTLIVTSTYIYTTPQLNPIESSMYIMLNY